MPVRFETAAIVGPGLIGGSLGMALRGRGIAGRVVGIGRRASSLRTAVGVGAVDETTLEVAEGVREADLVVIATPIRAFPALAGPVSEAMKQEAVLSEVASTKQSVIEVLSEALQSRPDLSLVPTHPMAGSEQRGAAHAREDLFEGSTCIITPLPRTPEGAVERVAEMWRAVGARPCLMDPLSHDRLVARISHLPHLAAAALMRLVTPEEGTLAGGGLLDSTRIASGDPRLWRDICATNAPQVCDALQELEAILRGARRMIESDDMEELEEWLREAKQKRDSLIEERPDT